MLKAAYSGPCHWKRWEVERARGCEQKNILAVLYEETDHSHVPLCSMFVLNWVSSQPTWDILMWFFDMFTNRLRLVANNAGIFCAFMAAVDAILFGFDSAGAKYVIE